jgi:UDP-N-acetylmuramate dehydrogenase
VFRNPPGESAGALIDRSGLKDLRIGGAVVSPKHANFIQAEPGATAADVRALVREVQRRVLAETGWALQPELHFVGFDDEPREGES